MITARRKRALARTSVGILIAITLSACSGSTHPAASVQTPAAATAPPEAADSAVAEIVITATRLPPARVAADATSRAPVKRRS